MSNNKEMAIVDVYGTDGSFLERVDFRGQDAGSRACNFANATGEIVTSGLSVILTGLVAPGSTGLRFSTFVPDGKDLGPDRLDAYDASVQGTPWVVKVFVVRSHDVPKRNPMHPKALTRDELVFGQRIQRYSHGRPLGRRAIVVREPFQDERNLSRRAWVVTVVTQAVSDEPLVCNWFLDLMGVMPRAEGGSTHWDEGHYTLAV